MSIDLTTLQPGLRYSLLTRNGAIGGLDDSGFTTDQSEYAIWQWESQEDREYLQFVEVFNAVAEVHGEDPGVVMRG